MDKIRLNNTSQPASQPPKRHGLPYQKWKVFIDEDPETLEKISNVTYFLHPTFPKPVRTATNAEDRFSLETEGWGEFEIRARVEFKDGSVENTSYHLDLGKGE